jgi:hypothetical protein
VSRSSLRKRRHLLERIRDQDQVVIGEFIQRSTPRCRRCRCWRVET